METRDHESPKEQLLGASRIRLGLKEEWDLGGTAFQTKAQGQGSDPGILRQERRGRRDPCQEGSDLGKSTTG